MSGIILCDKCGNTMSCMQSNRSDGGEVTVYSCSKCGNNYESGFRFNKIINQFVKYLRFL